MWTGAVKCTMEFLCTADVTTFQSSSLRWTLKRGCTWSYIEQVFMGAFFTAWVAQRQYTNLTLYIMEFRIITMQISAPPPYHLQHLRTRSAGSITAANDRLMTGLLGYLKCVLWRFISLLIGCGTNRMVKNQNSVLLRTDFSPTHVRCTT